MWFCRLLWFVWFYSFSIKFWGMLFALTLLLMVEEVKYDVQMARRVLTAIPFFPYLPLHKTYYTRKCTVLRDEDTWWGLTILPLLLTRPSVFYSDSGRSSEMRTPVKSRVSGIHFILFYLATHATCKTTWQTTTLPLHQLCFEYYE